MTKYVEADGDWLRSLTQIWERVRGKQTRQRAYDGIRESFVFQSVSPTDDEPRAGQDCCRESQRNFALRDRRLMFASPCRMDERLCDDALRTSACNITRSLNLHIPPSPSDMIANDAAPHS